MNEERLKEIISSIRIPEPHPDAKDNAVHQALNAFDKKSAPATQGNGLLSRLKDRTTLDRSIFMNTRTLYAGAATAMVVVVSAVSFKEFQEMKGDVLVEPQKVAAVSVALPEDSVEQDIALSPQDAAREDAQVAPSEPKAYIPQAGRLRGTASMGATVAASPPPVPPSIPMADQAMSNSSSSTSSSSSTGGGAAQAFSMQSRMAPGIAGNVQAVDNVAIGMPYPGDEVYSQPPMGADQFKKVENNPIKLVSEQPVSTFSIDVDTASYAFIRRQLGYGQLPQPDAVRVEEMVNYFDYDYKLPKSKATPFEPNVTVLPSPWHKGNKLIHIGIKGYDVAKGEAPHSNLVFLIDTSGSMMQPDKLPLLINSLKMLVNHLDAEDTVSIVTYAGWAGTALEPTQIKDKKKIIAVLEQLQAGGSTAGAAGIQEAYRLAEAHFDKKGVNRVILATDGDFNVGITDPEELKHYIEKKRESGVFLSVLGFGEGNYNDALMQELAQNGNGNASYIDTINEARKVLVEEATSTLFPIAKDVKIQVEFNPAAVSEYRLIGYETRMLKREDFNNDKVDAGEIGAGHAVTAIYEVTPKGEQGSIDPSRYGKEEPVKAVEGHGDEYAFLKIRYKLPKESKSHLLTTPITKEAEVAKMEEASEDARFAVSVAAFGQKLKGEDALSGFSYERIAKLAGSALGKDAYGYRHEFLGLVKNAASLGEDNAATINPDVPLASPPVEDAPGVPTGAYR